MFSSLLVIVQVLDVPVEDSSLSSLVVILSASLESGFEPSHYASFEACAIIVLSSLLNEAIFISSWLTIHSLSVEVASSSVLSVAIRLLTIVVVVTIVGTISVVLNPLVLVLTFLLVWHLSVLIVLPIMTYLI